MDRTERFYKIELLLRRQGCTSFAALQEELGISPATLKRDLQYLRDRLSAPIVYDPGENGYRFAPPVVGESGGPRHELPGLWFSENEIHAMLTMHQLLAGLDDDGVLARHLQPLMDRLQGMLGTDESAARELMRRVKVIGTARRRVPSRHFELLGGALLQRRRVRLRYFKRSDRSSSEREISPQRLINYRSTWYLDAWCHGSDAMRRFALDAVQSAEVLEAHAKNVPLRELEAELDGGYGIYGGDARVKWATLVFEADAAQWVANEEWHPQQKARWLEPAPDEPPTRRRYELQVPYSEPNELAMDILRHGASVVATGDEPLVRLIAERLRAATARYDDPAEADVPPSPGRQPRRRSAAAVTVKSRRGVIT